MEFNKYDMFSYQLLDYLVTKHHYQIIRVQQHKDDIWVMNAEQEQYPVIRISSKSNESTLSDTDYIRNVHRVILNIIQREGPIIILNTNPDSTPIENEMMTQIRVTPTSVSDERILSTFHELKDVVHEHDNMEQEIVHLAKKIEEIQKVRQKKMLANVKAKSQPRVTYAFLACTLLVFVAWIILSLWIQEEEAIYVTLGAFYKMNVVAANEYWRLLSAGFIHAGFGAMLINGLAFYMVGKICESSYRRGQFSFIIILSIIFGNVFLLISESNVLTMGLGPAVYGISGAYIMHIIINRTIRFPFVQVGLLKIGLLCMILLFVQGQSMIAYLGGFLCGSIMGIFYHDEAHIMILKKHTAIACACFVLALAWFFMTHMSVGSIDKEFDNAIVEVYKHTSLNEYADYLRTCYNNQYRLESEI